MAAALHLDGSDLAGQISGIQGDPAGTLMMSQQPAKGNWIQYPLWCKGDHFGIFARRGCGRFQSGLAGPYATMMLGDLGATVIKVESRGGDATQHWCPPWTPQEGSTSSLSVNCNTRSIAMDLASAQGKRRGLELARRDVQGSAQVANPLRLSARRVSSRRRPSALGTGEKEILAWPDGGQSADGHKAAGTFR